EDGIRAATVTGVQTCALPIFRTGTAAWAGRASAALSGRSPPSDRRGERRVPRPGHGADAPPGRWRHGAVAILLPRRPGRGALRRSEERRVGKGSRAQGGEE